MNQEKNNFILGLTSGIAAVALIGFVMMSVAYFQKDETKPASNNNNNDNNVVQQDNNNPGAGDTQKADIKVENDDYIRGDKDAPVTIITFSDIQCPFCSRFHDTMRQVMEKYPNDVRWVFKHFPLDSLHPVARQAAQASECAGEQGKFWEYVDNLFDNQQSLTKEYLSTAAGAVGLNVSKFDSCVESGKYADAVNKDFSLGQSVGVTGTPASFINGEKVVGAVPVEQISAMIEGLK